MDERAAERELLLHPARQLPRRPVRKGIETGRSEELPDAPLALGFGLAEKAAEEVEILEDAQRRVEVAAETLRHVGDAGQTRPAMLWVVHVAVEGEHLALLDPADAGNEREQCRFADAIRSDESDHAIGRDREGHVVERDGSAIAMRYLPHPCSTCRRHGSFTVSMSGQLTSGSARTNPTPRIPVLT